MTEILRTPEERFADLPGYPFTPHYLDDLPGYDGLRIHYLDEPADVAAETGRVALCLHGEPTWSYLYRRMIPALTTAGYRVVAPDLLGFGKSDKPAVDAVYTVAFHRNMLLRLVEMLDLTRITLVCQDWGGMLGLTLPMAMPDRFTRMVIMNTALPDGGEPLPDGFLAWRAWADAHPDMAVARLMSRACPHLTAAEAAAYDAPFPDRRYKAGVRRFPQLVPDRAELEAARIVGEAKQWLATHWHGQTFVAAGAQDPVFTPDAMAKLAETINGCPPPLVLKEAGHFTPEWGETVAEAALAAFGGKG